MFTRDEADNILLEINEPMLTDAEFESMTVSNNVYIELSNVIQNLRGGVGSAFTKLKALAKTYGVDLSKKEYSNIFIGAVLN